MAGPPTVRATPVFNRRFRPQDEVERQRERGDREAAARARAERDAENERLKYAQVK